jgi:hypothetical protein
MPRPHVVADTKQEPGSSEGVEAEPPVAPDIVPVAGMDCAPPVRGFIPCDLLFYLEKNDRAWGAQVTRLSGDDMRGIHDGLRASLRSVRAALP